MTRAEKIRRKAIKDGYDTLKSDEDKLAWRMGTARALGCSRQAVESALVRTPEPGKPRGGRPSAPDSLRSMVSRCRHFDAREPFVQALRSAVSDDDTEATRAAAAEIERFDERDARKGRGT